MTKRYFRYFLAFGIALGVSLPTLGQEAQAFGSTSKKKASTEAVEKTGLKMTDIKVGDGDEAKPGVEVRVHYTGWLEGGDRHGEKFDSSRDSNSPFKFKLGNGEVIKGWDIGVNGMREGGVRELIIPAHLAYGKRGFGDAIPPDSTLKFEVELLKVKVPPTLTEVDSATLKKMLAEGVAVVDIRTDAERAKTGMIEGAVSVPAYHDDMKMRRDYLINVLKQAKLFDKLIIVGNTGKYTANLGEFMIGRYGYHKLHHLKGGMAQWIAEGNPVVKQ